MPKIVDKPQMQGRIMDAAFGCFTRQGYHATKMTDVAKQAGLAKGTLYLYFPSKEDLTVALLGRYFDEIGTVLDRVPPQTLDALLDELRTALMPSPEQIGATRLFFDILGPGFALPGGRQVVGAFFDRLGGHYAHALAHLMTLGQVRDGVNPTATGSAIAAMADGMIIHLALFEPDKTVYAARLDAAISLLADGLRPG